MPSQALPRSAPGMPRFAASQAPGTEGKDVIEDAIEAGGELVDGVGREDVRFGDDRVAAVVVDVLVAAKGVLSDQVGEPPGTKLVA